MVSRIFWWTVVCGKTYEIKLKAVPKHVITPQRSNFYDLEIQDEGERPSAPDCVELFTESANFAAHRVTAREVERDTTPSKTSPQISKWLEECDQHPCCPRQTDSPLPTRLIDLVSAKIWHTNGVLGKFVALSCCWGTGSQIQLASDNIETLMQHLDFNDLPQTIKDAVLVTRSLSIRYLWVCSALHMIEIHDWYV